MNQTKIAGLVSQAVKLDREIAEKSEHLKRLKGQLLAAARGGLQPTTPTEGGGWSLTFEGADGCVARVTQPADKLKNSIDAEKPAGARLMMLVGRLKEELFTPSLKYVPVENFRTRVASLFPPATASRILQAATGESSPTVSFETKEG
jgi:hypothetical protein